MLGGGGRWGHTLWLSLTSDTSADHEAIYLISFFFPLLPAPNKIALRKWYALEYEMILKNRNCY